MARGRGRVSRNRPRTPDACCSQLRLFGCAAEVTTDTDQWRRFCSWPIVQRVAALFEGDAWRSSILAISGEGLLPEGSHRGFWPWRPCFPQERKRGIGVGIHQETPATQVWSPCSGEGSNRRPAGGRGALAGVSAPASTGRTRRVSCCGAAAGGGSRRGGRRTRES